MKKGNITSYEAFLNESMGSYGSVAVGLHSDGGWSAVGIPTARDQEVLKKIMRDNNMDGMTTGMEEFQIKDDGDFVVLDGDSGEFKLVREGDVYTSNYGYVFPILQPGKFFVVSASGHTTDAAIVSAVDLLNL